MNSGIRSPACSATIRTVESTIIGAVDKYDTHHHFSKMPTDLVDLGVRLPAKTAKAPAGRRPI
jgi:hypothetical protein